jgi:septum formation protein
MVTRIPFNRICLASQSPRRQALLQQIGVSFDVFPANIDEQKQPGETPSEYVKRLSLAKALAVWQEPCFSKDRPVLASDTAVVLGDEVLGKPIDEAEGKAMLRALSGRWHQVITGVALIYGEQNSYRECISKVLFRPLSDTDIEHYWLTGEGRDKAGCYAVQGYAATFIRTIEGSFSGIMGLPLFETCELLDQWNIVYWPHQTGQPQTTASDRR